ncbi:hypothetical protein V1515DRAFT_641052 [Lipomyces mesembrius]
MTTVNEPGAALAVAFHDAGLQVYAMARNPAKMSHLVSLGIKTLTLDVLSDSSIAESYAGATYGMPVSDLSIVESKKLFDLNAFLPLLLKSKGMIVNHTSVVSSMAIPFHSAYSASKAAMAMFSDSQRLELEPFGVTGRINIFKNQKEHTPNFLPKGSIYEPEREAVESAMRYDKMAAAGIPASQWAGQVVQDLLKKKPPITIWKGIFPHGMLDGTMKTTELDIVEQKLRK